MCHLKVFIGDIYITLLNCVSNIYTFICVYFDLK